MDEDTKAIMARVFTPVTREATVYRFYLGENHEDMIAFLKKVFKVVMTHDDWLYTTVICWD